MSGVQTPAAAKYLRREMDPVAREFYRRLAEDGQLATTRCGACGVTSFPPRARCPRCGEAPEWVELPRTGRLYAFTTEETALRFTAPAVLALVELGEVTVPAIARTGYAELRVGQEVSVELFREPDTGLTLLELSRAARTSAR
jgi:hypothetical protein